MTVPAATVAPLHLQVLAMQARVDWPGVIRDIQRSTWLAGASQRRSNRSIAEACGRGENWTWALKNIPGTEPKFHDGLLLLGLWVESTGKPAGELPVHRESEQGRR